MTPTRHNGGLNATAYALPAGASKGIARQYSISINGRFRAPLGIPDSLDPATFVLVFKNTDSGGRNTILRFPMQGGKGKPSCWLQPTGCPLSIVRALLDEGEYIVSFQAKKKSGTPVDLCYFTDRNPLGTHEPSLATIVTVDGTRTQLTLNPTIQMNFDQVP